MRANIYISSYCTRVLDNDVELLAKAIDIISSHRDEHQIEVTTLLKIFKGTLHVLPLIIIQMHS